MYNLFTLPVDWLLKHQGFRVQRLVQGHVGVKMMFVMMSSVTEVQDVCLNGSVLWRQLGYLVKVHPWWENSLTFQCIVHVHFQKLNSQFQERYSAFSPSHFPSTLHLLLSFGFHFPGRKNKLDPYILARCDLPTSPTPEHTHTHTRTPHSYFPHLFFLELLTGFI